MNPPPSPKTAASPPPSRMPSGKELAKVSLGKNIESGAARRRPMGGGSVRRPLHPQPRRRIRLLRRQRNVPVRQRRSQALAAPMTSSARRKSNPSPSARPARQIPHGNSPATTKRRNSNSKARPAPKCSTPPPPRRSRRLFSYARFEDVVPADKVAERSDTAGKRTATIETFEGFTYTVQHHRPAEGAACRQVSSSPSTSPPTCPRSARRRKAKNPRTPRPRTPPSPTASRPSTKNSPRKKPSPDVTFEVAKTTVEPLLKERDALITKATPPTADAPAPEAAVQNHPGGMIARPRVTATTPPIEAVTPPDLRATCRRGSEGREVILTSRARRSPAGSCIVSRDRAR